MTASAADGYLFLSLLQARVGRSLLSRLGDFPPERLLGLTVAEAADRLALTPRAARSFAEIQAAFDAAGPRRILAEGGYDVLTLADEDYPESLRGIPDPPPALYVDGAIPGGPWVAVVGSRKASPTGIEAARSLGRALGERGVCVVSGLALGIDAAAHEGAIAAGGPTVGVLGCGIDVVYPRGNRALFAEVGRSGAVVSEYYLGEAPLAWRFPARNRIIAGLADALVVVEATEKSGSLITARHALDSGRDVWAVPGPMAAAECRGSNKLLADGAAVLWDVPEFVDAVAPEAARPAAATLTAAEVPPELPSGEAAALAGVGFVPTAVDEVASRTGVGMSELLSALAMLEIKGYVARDAGGAFVRRA